MADEFSSISNDTLRNIESLRSSMKDISSSTTKTSKALKDQDSFLAAFESNFSKINSSASKFAEIQDKARKSAQGTIEAFKEQQKQLSVIRSLNVQIDNLYEAMLNASEQEAKLLKRQVENLSDARDNAKELANEFGKLTEDSVKLDKSTQWFSAISEVVKDIPGLRKLSSPFEAAVQASRETVLNNAKIKSINDSISSLGKDALKTGKGLTQEKLKELGLSEITQGKTAKGAAKLLKQYQEQNKIQNAGIAGLQAGFKYLGPIIKGVLGPLAIITTIVSAIKFFVNAMFEADKRVTSLSRNLQLSKEEAQGIDSYFKSIKGSLETEYKLTKEIYQAQSELSELSAASVLYSKDNLDAQIQLTKEYGLQAQDAANLNKLFIVNGENANDALDVAAQTTSEFFKKNKILFNERKLLEQASKVSGQLLVSFKGSTAELIKSVAQANKLGITLEQAKNISESMLNFEESISSELEAELLTGKNLNLDRARALSLQGKYAEAAEETLKNVGSLEDFQRMNVIQQQALAKAAGVTVDQLSDALIQQKLISKESQSQYARLKEAKQDELARRFALGQYDAKEIEAANKRLDAQEKFNLSMDKVKEVFTDLVDGGALDAISNAATALADTIASGGSLFSFFGKSDLSKNLEKRSLEQAQTTKNELEQKIKDKEKLTEGELKRLEQANERLNQKTEGSRTSYTGRAVLTAKEGETYREIGRHQKMATGGIVTGPTKALVGEAGPEAVIPLNQFYAKLDQLISAVEKGGNIYLDGTKVGTAMATNGFRVQ
jgi:hypothetical protein